MTATTINSPPSRMKKYARLCIARFAILPGYADFCQPFQVLPALYLSLNSTFEPFFAIFVFSCSVDYFQFDSFVFKVSTLDMVKSLVRSRSQRDKINLIPIFSVRRGQIELSGGLEMNNWKQEEANLMKWQFTTGK